MKLSARNKLKGKVVEVKKGVTTSHVRIDVGGQVVTAATGKRVFNQYGAMRVVPAKHPNVEKGSCAPIHLSE